MSKSNALKKADVSDTAPLMLRRVTKKPQLLLVPIVMNMTVVSSSGRNPEMSDQMSDMTAPRHDG